MCIILYLCFYVKLFLSMLCFRSRGFPVWLKYVPGMSFRTDNEPFKVSNFETIVNT